MSNKTLAFQSKSFSSIMDTSFRIFSQNFVELVKVALICNAPVLALQMTAASLGPNPDPAVIIPIGIIGLIVNVFAMSLMAGAMTTLISNLYLNRETNAVDAIKSTFSCLGSIIGGQIRVGLWVFLGILLLVIPGIIWMFSLLLVVPAIVLENKSASEALARSKELTKYNRGKVVGVVVGMGVLIFIVILGFGAAWGVGMSMAGIDLHGVISTTGQNLIGYILQPLSSIALVLVYYDLRITHEGFDLEMLSTELGSTEGN